MQLVSDGSEVASLLDETRTVNSSSGRLACPMTAVLEGQLIADEQAPSAQGYVHEER
jgi:hypothetical protein